MPRGAAPGERRGGRLAGTPNKRTKIGDVTARLESLGCDPIEGMARLALDKSNSPELRGKMHAELAQYVYPKRKALEVTGAGGTPLIPMSTVDEILKGL